MSIISANKEAKREARRIYEEKLAEMRTAEHIAMNEMLTILRTASRPMSAAQIEATCTNGISKHEVAGNLLAMKDGCSRYQCFRPSGWSAPQVNIPKPDGYRGNGELITVKSGVKRRATVIEVDESGRIIPDTQRIVTICESNLYSIKKV